MSRSATTAPSRGARPLRAGSLALALGAVSALGSAACSTPEPPQLTPQIVQVTDVSPAGLGLRLQLNAYNPNGITLSVRSLTARLTLADRIDLGTTELPGGTSLAPKANTPVVADLRVPWRNAAEVAALAATQASAPYRIEGKARFGGEKLNVELPFQLQGTLAREQLMQAGLRGLPGLPLPGFGQ
ncbi:MAG TPA: LEA type 2 family protein [Polyangiaceae bacterium]|nr:LEA type 2 family protein [Polyangiaceae bacterium]